MHDVSPPYCGLALTPQPGTGNPYPRLLSWLRGTGRFTAAEPPRGNGAHGNLTGYIPQHGLEGIPITVSFDPSPSISFCSG